MTQNQFQEAIVLRGKIREYQEANKMIDSSPELQLSVSNLSNERTYFIIKDLAIIGRIQKVITSYILELSNEFETL